MPAAYPVALVLALKDIPYLSSAFGLVSRSTFPGPGPTTSRLTMKPRPTCTPSCSASSRAGPECLATTATGPPVSARSGDRGRGCGRPKQGGPVPPATGPTHRLRRGAKGWRYYPPDYPNTRAMEKGIDVAVAVDMIRMGLANEMDVAILFSSDKDLLPAVEMLIDRRICHVETAAWSDSHRIRMDGSQLPWCHFLNAETFALVRDWYDYSGD